MIDNLTEAIAHAKKVAENVKYNANTFTESDLLDENCRQAKAECLECAAEHEQLAAWLEELAERREADRWIPVTERPPKEYGKYFVTIDYGDERIVTITKYSQHGWFLEGVTAWRYLPEPYTESEEENE